MSIFKRNPRLFFTLGALSLAAALTACGGSDDPVTEPVVTTPAVAVVVLPAAGTSTGLDDDGTVNYKVLSPDGSDRPVSAVVANADGDGTLSLTDGADTYAVTATSAWANVLWPDGATGLLALNGNANLICDTASDEGEVGLSGNLTQVTSLSELHGKSFVFKTCANGAVADDGGIKFNADGSAQFTDADGVSDFDAAVVAEYFSEAGWRINGGVFKARAFYRTASDGTRQYVILDISNDVLDDGSPDNTVSLVVEAAAPR